MFSRMAPTQPKKDTKKMMTLMKAMMPRHQSRPYTLLASVDSMEAVRAMPTKPQTCQIRFRFIGVMGSTNLTMSQHN